MRDLVVTENITLDGVIDATGDWFMPTEASQDVGDVAEVLAEQREQADALLLGRATFEAFREFWPKQTQDETGTSDYLNRVHKYVVSSTLDEPGWEPSTVLRGLDDVRALKQGDGADIVTTGSLGLVPALVSSGLVDEYRLFTYPVVLGQGQRLFADATEVPALRLVECRRFRSGIALLRYRTDAGGTVAKARYDKDSRVDAYIDALPDWQQAICRDVRDLVHAADPEVEETVKRSVQPYFVLQGNICALLAARDHVNVFLYDGAIVPDPEGIITAGHDNQTARTVGLREGETVNAKALTAMFRQIIANNRAGGWRTLKREAGS